MKNEAGFSILYHYQFHTLPYLTLPHLTLPYLNLPYLTLPYIILFLFFSFDTRL